MAFRSRRSRRSAPRKRAIWVNIPFGGVTFTESVGTQLLLTPEDWEAQFSGTANETCVLRAVVGELILQQTVVGTLGGNAFWGIYVADKDATVAPVFTVAGMSDSDWLHVGCRSTATSVTSNPITVFGWQGVQPVRIKAKRRLKSRDAVYIAGQFGSDAAAPSAVIGGLLRFLVARD